MRINDHGSVVVSERVDDRRRSRVASFDVVCEQSLPPEQQMAVARCIERWKPVHAHYKLRVRKGGKVRTLPEVPIVPTQGLTPPELRPPFGDPPAAGGGADP